ncbi:hypothetical protein C8R46DRAFT_1268299 [Mycena filopes]|nr:hypothetical protein C8R46DRAFT_1268299 [Mycena filopes]
MSTLQLQVQVASGEPKFIATTHPRPLPTEIVCDIFLASLPDGDPLIDAEASPLLLCQVCHWWREVAWGLPELWRRMHIIEPFNGESAKALTDNVITPWLRDWSAELPLCISITLPSKNIWNPLATPPSETRPFIPGTTTQEINHLTHSHRAANANEQGSGADTGFRVLDELIAHASRWKRVRLVLPQYKSKENLDHWMKPLRALSAAKLNWQLEHFEVGHELDPYYSGSYIIPLRSDLLFLERKTLRRLTIPGILLENGRPGDFSPPLELEWAKLEFLSLTSVGEDRRHLASFNIIYDALQKCNALKECAFTVRNEVNDYQHKVLQLHHLSSLQITVITQTSQLAVDAGLMAQEPHMVFHLDLPALRDLHYSTEIPFTSPAPPSTSNRPPAPPNPISLFTSNNAESQSLWLLEVLKLQIVNVPSTLFTGLAALQSLQELHVMKHRNCKSGLRPVFDDLDPSVCPILHTVTFVGLDGSYFAGEEEERKLDKEGKEEKKLAGLQSLAAFVKRCTDPSLKRLHLQFEQEATVPREYDKVIALLGGFDAVRRVSEREGGGDRRVVHCSDNDGALAVELEYYTPVEEERPLIFPSGSE